MLSHNETEELQIILIKKAFISNALRSNYCTNRAAIETGFGIHALLNIRKHQ